MSDPGGEVLGADMEEDNGGPLKKEGGKNLIGVGMGDELAHRVWERSLRHVGRSALGMRKIAQRTLQAIASSLQKGAWH